MTAEEEAAIVSAPTLPMGPDDAPPAGRSDTETLAVPSGEVGLLGRALARLRSIFAEPRRTARRWGGVSIMRIWQIRHHRPGEGLFGRAMSRLRLLWKGHERVTYPNGSVYEGGLRDGKRHGVGTLTYSCGAVYEGEWKDGMRHGRGTYTYENGDVYEGDFQNDKCCGRGTLKYADGEVYEGEWKDNKAHGIGKRIYADGDVYEGGWQNGLMHGTGTYEWLDGDVYEGEWANDVEHGTGKKIFDNGDVYEGEWRDGKSHGTGKRIYDNGDVYEGEWKDGMKHGTGTCKWADGDVYEGEWKDDVEHGKGKEMYDDGDVYEGEWRNGKWHGLGTYKYASGDVYEGECKDDKWHGLGTHKYPDGSIQEREYRGGARIFLPTPPKEEIRHALSSVLLKDGDGKASFDGIDGKFISYLADLLHESSLAQQMNCSVEGILRPWLKGFSFEDNLSKKCSDAVLKCAKSRWVSPTHQPRMKNYVICVNVVDEGDGTRERYALLLYCPFETFFKNYATSRNVSVRRFEHNGNALFLSSIGKKSPIVLGLKEGDEIKVVPVFTKATVTEEKESEPKQKSRKGKKKKHRKSNKKKSMPVLPPERKEEKWKEQHSHALSRVFAEADPVFRDTRRRLAAMNLQRTVPKQRYAKAKKEPVAEIVDNPSEHGIGGKAGKSYFIVQVGEAKNLYNTRAKPSAGRCKQPSGRIAREIDLHGCTKEEALAKLDACLPEWIDVAMKGEYPWVITAKIVCGGGTQTVAEGVEGWIKRNPNVSNAPKNLFS